jgi:hypothetical protein
MSLTQDQIDARRSGIGGSDLYALVKGEWGKIYDAKVHGIVEDLSDNLGVQIGVATEGVHLRFLSRAYAHPITKYDGPTVHDSEWPVMLCHPDALIMKPYTLVELKHTSAFAKMPDMIESYMPQLTHNMHVTGCNQAIFSVIFGAGQAATNIKASPSSARRSIGSISGAAR